MDAVKFENVSYKYKDNENAETLNAEQNTLPEYALNNVSFEIPEKQFVAILGHNGSGKSTAAKLINGLLLPKSGEVTVFGKNSKDTETLFDIRKSVGMVFQNPDNQMIASIVEDDIAFGPENIGIKPDEISKRVDWALECVGMEKFRKSSASRLSGGQKQRIAIAGALALKPQILVLDESTAMLDPLGRKEVLKVVKSLNADLNMTVVLITHFMEEAAEADRIIVLSDGEKVFDDTPRKVFENYEELEGIGLSVPFATKVAYNLNKNGINIDKTVLTTEELYREICRLL